MNEKRMGTVVLILLILLNLVLFGYYSYQKISEKRVSVERIEQIRELYRQSGVDIQTEPDRENQQLPILELGEANLDQMVESLLSASYEKSFIYGSKVQYTMGSLEILTDRMNHLISYEDKARTSEDALRESLDVEEWARMQRITEAEAEEVLEKSAWEFAKKWLGDDIILARSEKKDKGYEYIFYPIREDMVLYFNELKIWMMEGSVVAAELIYWEVKGETEESYTLMPIDEILYALLGSIKGDLEDNQTDEVVQIVNGYQLVKTDEQYKAVPAITIVMKSGKEYAMNRTAV